MLHSLCCAVLCSYNSFAFASVLSQIRGPVRCSALLGELGGVFGCLVSAAVCPEGWVPETPNRKAHRQMVHQVRMRKSGLCVFFVCVCG